MRRFLRGIGCILISSMPLLLTMVIQVVITALLMLGSALMAAGMGGLSGDVLIDVLYEFWMEDAFNGALYVCYSLVLLLVFGLWYHKMRKSDEERVGMGEVLNVKVLFSFVLLAVGLQYLSGYLMAIAGSLNPGWLDSYEELIEDSGILEGSFLISIYSCVLAPISEECVFRGVTYVYAKRGFPVGFAILLQAVLFGVFHLNIIQGIYATFLGIFLGYVCWKGGTLFLSILFHAAFNIAGTFLMDYLYFDLDGALAGILFLVLGIVLTVLGIKLFNSGVGRTGDEAWTEM